MMLRLLALPALALPAAVTLPLHPPSCYPLFASLSSCSSLLPSFALVIVSASPPPPPASCSCPSCCCFSTWFFFFSSCCCPPLSLLPSLPLHFTPFLLLFSLSAPSPFPPSSASFSSFYYFCCYCCCCCCSGEG